MVLIQFSVLHGVTYLPFFSTCNGEIDVITQRDFTGNGSGYIKKKPNRNFYIVEEKY